MITAKRKYGTSKLVHCLKCSKSFMRCESKISSKGSFCSRLCNARYFADKRKRSLEVRFWDLVDKNGDCWIWRGTKFRNGYGRIHEVTDYGKHRTLQAHRVAYRLANGDIPDCLCVCHKCDTPLCVNPGHLFLGTSQDNNADKVAKGRVARGERSGNHKLTDANVSEIRHKALKGRTHDSLAAEYGVWQCTISSVVSGKTWAHVGATNG